MTWPALPFKFIQLPPATLSLPLHCMTTKCLQPRPEFALPPQDSSSTTEHAWLGALVSMSSSLSPLIFLVALSWLNAYLHSRKVMAAVLKKCLQLFCGSQAEPSSDGLSQAARCHCICQFITQQGKHGWPVLLCIKAPGQQLLGFFAPLI